MVGTYQQQEQPCLLFQLLLLLWYIMLHCSKFLIVLSFTNYISLNCEFHGGKAGQVLGSPCPGCFCFYDLVGDEEGGGGWFVHLDIEGDVNCDVLLGNLV